MQRWCGSKALHLLGNGAMYAVCVGVGFFEFRGIAWGSTKPNGKGGGGLGLNGVSVG
jgi:hypothetical protein